MLLSLIFVGGDEMDELQDLSNLIIKHDSPKKNVFETQNHTTVVGNVGNSVTLPCTVNMEVKYGMVSSFVLRFNWKQTIHDFFLSKQVYYTGHN